MAGEFSKPTHPFTPFQSDNHLVIQWMLSSAAKIYPLSKRLNELNVAALPEMFSYYPSTPWQKSPIYQFKEASFHFYENAKGKCPLRFFLLVQDAISSFHSGCETWKHFCLPSKLEQMPKRIETRVKKYTQNFCKAFNKIMKEFPSLLSSYQASENVILMILKNKEIYQEIYGTHFLPFMLQSPLSTGELVEFMVKKYKERGHETFAAELSILFGSPAS